MIARLIINSFKTDIKFIVRDPMLLLSIIAPGMIIVFLKLAFPLLSVFIFSETGLDIDIYYTIVALTMIPVIPLLFGLVYAFILLDENDSHILQVIAVTPAGKRNFLYMRMIVPAVISFVFIVGTMVITNPVPGEGWLRHLIIACLLSLQAPFVFLFIGCLAANKIEGLAMSKLYGIFVAAVPLGLILHHPWNYLAFFSPLYWISWGWIISSPLESFIYAIIALTTSLIPGIIIFRYFLNKHTV